MLTGGFVLLPTKSVYLNIFGSVFKVLRQGSPELLFNYGLY
jgi:hypothetical protein